MPDLLHGKTGGKQLDMFEFSSKFSFAWEATRTFRVSCADDLFLFLQLACEARRNVRASMVTA